MTSAIGGNTLAPLESNERRRDHWCAIALVAAALLDVASRLPAMYDTPNVRLIPYAWLTTLAEACVLAVLARAFVEGRHRLIASAFVVGFCATALNTVLFGLTYRLDRSSYIFVTRPFWLAFAAAVLMLAVAARALTVVRTEPRRRSAVPFVFCAVVAVTVFITVKTVWRPILGPGWFAQTVDLVLYAAVAAIPLFAARRAAPGALIVCGLAATLTLTFVDDMLARFFLHPAPNDLGHYVLLATCIALLVAFAASIYLRTAPAAAER